MTTYTITTPVNIDSLATKTGGDVYNINGGELTIDQDSRYGTNQNTSASLGNITLSATLGGTLNINATKVRLIPYDTGTGNVPTSNTTISQGSASGLLIGVYSALNVAPTTAGSAMPASGFIKIKQWNDVSYSSGALTGVGASATGADVTGWIELVGDNAGTLTVNRLNTCTILGDWYSVGTTDGNRSTTYQIPSNGSNVYIPGVWVETGTSTNQYEFYPCAGSLPALIANIQTDAIRGKVCWISTAGLLRFGHDGTNSTGGYIVPFGRRIRIPNIITSCCTTAARTANVLPDATPTNRYEFLTTGAGVIDIRKANMSWYLNFLQPYSVYLENTGTFTSCLISEAATAFTLNDFHIGQEAANSQNTITISQCPEGGEITNCKFVRYSLGSSGFYLANISDSDNINFTDVSLISLVKNGHATTGCAVITRLRNSIFTNLLIGGSGRCALVTCENLNFINTSYFDNIANTTGTTIPMYAFDISTGSKNILVNGFHFNGLTLVQPYSGLASITAGVNGVKVRNIGTYNSPLDMGAPGSTQGWTRSTTTATVNHTAHGLKVGDTIYVLISDSVAAITVGSKTVASVPNADSFTFTCLNAGNASGNLYYYPTMLGTFLNLVAGGYCQNIKVQNCYLSNTRGSLISADNSYKGIIFESVFGNLPLNMSILPVDSIFKNIGSAIIHAAQTSVYGTSFLDYFITGVPTNTSSQSWSRSSTTATVTSNEHKLRTGDIISVTVSDSEAAITLGNKTITVLSENTFTFTCLNAGNSSGVLTYIPLNSRIGIICNEKTSSTNSYYTIDVSPVNFTSAGGLYMPTINGEITYEIPYYIIGHKSFPIAEAVMAGGTITNYDITYAIDTGSGFGSFKNLSYSRTGAGGSNGSTNVTMTSTTGVNVGDYVFGTNINGNAKVSSITDSTTIVVDKPNLGTVSGTLRFNQLPNETIPETGFKLKIKIKTIATNATAITSLYFNTESDHTTRARQYIMDYSTITLTGLKTGTEIRVYKDDGGNNGDYIDGIESTSGSTFSFEAESNSTINIMINHLNYLPADIWGYLVEESDVSIPIAQFIDRQYSN